MATLRRPPSHPETVFTYAAPRLVFGSGAVADAVHEVGSTGRVLVVTDAGVAATGIPERVADGLRGSGCAVEVYDGSRVEPTDASMREAVEWARSHGPWAAIVAVGGGSSIDTAKAVNLMTTNPGDLIDYVNQPLGGGLAPTRPLLPLIAVPTTTGTGSESTAVCVLDLLDRQVKTGISHPMLRPVMAVVDPDLTVSQPPMVTACSGLDILCHALESYTARPFDSFEAKVPAARVAYCGANPVSDMWAERAMSLLSESFVAAVRDGGDRMARGRMALAATLAGMGFGNAGVHIPHANAYPIAGRAHHYEPAGYPTGPLIPHGMAVAATAAEALAVTFDASPDRHVRAARLLDPAAESDEPRDLLPGVVRRLAREVGVPGCLHDLGYAESDIDALVEGSLAQRRLLDLSPVEVDGDDIAGIFARSLHA